MKTSRYHFKKIDSTNNWAKQQAHLFDFDELTVVTADEQTAGRGRFKRKWISPPGQNIYASFCFFLEKNRKDGGNIPQMMALAGAEILEQYGFRPTLKWPNDILLSQKKISGILAETTPLDEKLCVIIGIGININMTEEWLKKIDLPATSLFIESGKIFDVQKIFNTLQKNFYKKLRLFIERGFTPFLDDYKRRMELSLNQKICFHDNQKIWEGVFHSINQDGSLNLLLDEGKLKPFFAGEILWPEQDFKFH